MRWNIGSTSGSSSTSASPDTILPADHPAIPSSSSSSSSPRPPASCPMHNNPEAAQSMLKSSAPRPLTGAAKCPIQHDKPSDLNPLNAIPKGLSATERQPGQSLDLPTDRTASSIPRPKGSSAMGQDADEDAGPVWDYPSPQQFYNALSRKGWETPEDSIEMMVAIHNFLNEQAWEEVMKWEKRLPGGESAQLAKFQGNPGKLSPKARIHLWLGTLFPSKFNTEPPFDRHDWVVKRPAANDAQTRYVIDYYSAPPDEDGNPVFSLDVRPALDSLESVNQRIRMGYEEWMKGEN